MDMRVSRLARLLDDKELAERLVAAGFTTPRLIKTATNTALRAVHGIGDATVSRLRERFPVG